MIYPTDRLLRLAQALPDTARFVETRSLLLNNTCEVFGLEESDGLHFVVCEPNPDLICIIGNPAIETIQQAIALIKSTGVVLAFDDNFERVTDALPGWQAERATLHLLGASPQLPEVPAGRVRFITKTEIAALTDLPDELKEELLGAAEFSPIAATIADDQPVSFCYSGSETETLWDISIDTLESYRQRGYAALSVAFLIDHMKRRGKLPVWGAVASNAASLGLAAKLGFVAVDELFVFEQNS